MSYIKTAVAVAVEYDTQVESVWNALCLRPAHCQSQARRDGDASERDVIKRRVLCLDKSLEINR